MNRLVMNVSTILEWLGTPAGIVRVEYELFKQIYKISKGNLNCVYLNKNTNTWKPVSAFILTRLFFDDSVLTHEPNKSSYVDTNDFLPDSNDIFVSVGSDWSFNVPDTIENIYKGNRVLVSACYDLIPLLYPEYTPGPEFFDQFSYHFKKVAQISRSVFAISNNSKTDLINFWDKNSLKNTPPIHVVPLAGLNSISNIDELNETEKKSLAQLQGNGDYVLYVSTMESRKNHKLLLNIWRQLFSERGANCPQLLLVGNKGWGSDNLIEQLMRMSAAKEHRVLWWSGVSDQLLKCLYANTLFSVFPSIYEGWGLAATESLSFGKVCIVSNNSALCEATQGLMPNYHPLDYPSWIKEITHLIDDRSYREDLEKQIPLNFKPLTWDDFGRKFYSSLL